MATASAAAAPRPLLRVAVVGHVDHGKSTLVGRLLHETGSLPEGKLAAIEAMCKRRGMPFEWAFITDALQAERDQGVTIDASYIRFSTATRDYVLIDAPGHREFIKNMISGAADCDAALVVIDATEGIREQSRRHGFLLHLLGVQQIAAAVSKMDLAEYDVHRFTAIEHEFRSCLADIGVTLSTVIPLSARLGENVFERSQKMPWYCGPTVMEALDSFDPLTPPLNLPLRLPVQDIYRFDSRRIIAGRIESGQLRVGDTVLFSPSNHTAVIKSLEGWSVETPILGAGARDCVGITLTEQIFVERGDVISHPENPPMETTVLRARLFWLGAKPLMAGTRLTLRINTAEALAEVEAVERVIDAAEMAAVNLGSVAHNCVADVILRTGRVLALDAASVNRRTGRIVLQDGYDIVGGGLVDMAGYPDQRQIITRRATNISTVEHRVTRAMREARNAHCGGVLWFTGFSGAGKSTLAIELERRLFEAGYQVYVLDGDNLRHGLNANLGFSPEERAENIRRVGEVAALFAAAGMLVITAFISPYREDRARARKAAGNGFHEIYIKADLGVCEARDPKGLYRRARAGEISDFTGVSAPYEPPAACDLIVDTATQGVEQSVRSLLDFVQRRFPLTTTGL